MRDLPFSLFFKTLIRRIALLKRYYYQSDEDFNCAHLLEKAGSITMVDSTLHWYDWQRFSSRQKVRMSLGGLVGEITYKGDLEEFLPFIKLGEIIHIGKNTSFGLGKYEVIEG